MHRLHPSPLSEDDIWRTVMEVVEKGERNPNRILAAVFEHHGEEGVDLLLTRLSEVPLPSTD